jgi:hypothetical protein
MAPPGGVAFGLIATVLTASALPARRRLQPVTPGTIVHGAGSGQDDFQPYFAFLDQNASAAPMMAMTYLGLDTLNTTANNTVAQWFTDLNATLSSYGSEEDVFLVSQIGLALPDHGKEVKVADGEYDQAIRALVYGLASLAPRPVYLRIGYECNGDWHSFNPSNYKKAFQRVASALHGDPVTNQTVATVWDITCDQSNNYDDWDPGADAADWWGVNIYSGGSDPLSKCVTGYLDKARGNKLPVLLGEVSPRGRFTNATSSWNSWFDPYFRMLEAYNDTVLVTSYINRQWFSNPSYRSWGDSRIQTEGALESGVQPKYVEKLKGPQWLNKAGKAEVLGRLGLAPAPSALG